MAAITTAIALAGLAVSAYGVYESTQGAKQQTGAQTQEIQLEQQQDAVRRKAMEVNAQRQQTENIRNTIRARAMATNNAVNQGAEFGSGIQGGYGQIQGQSNVNEVGIASALNSGEQMFDLNAQIGQQKIAYAQAGGQVAMGNALTGFGKGITGAAGTADNLFSTASSGVSYIKGLTGSQPFTGGLGKGDV